MIPIVIGGTPMTGKSPIADLLIGEGWIRTDDYLKYPYEEQADRIAELLHSSDSPGLVGTLACRGVRRFLELHRGRPCTVFIWLTKAYELSLPQHKGAYKGITTVYNQIYFPMIERGVLVLSNPSGLTIPKDVL